VTDGLGLFDNSRGEIGHGDDDYEDERPRQRRPKRPKRRATFWVVAAVVVALIAAGAYYGLTQILGFGSYDDFAGSGESDVVVEVKSGQGTGDIGTVLKEKNVVASARAFTAASEDQAKVKSIQPGFYVMKTKMSGQAAVDKIIDKKSRVGQLQIKAGTQLDDVTQPDKKITPGIFSLISEAGAVTLNGKKAGPSVEELRKVAETADLGKLGVPAWAVPDASKAEPKRRLEGLVTPGVSDIMPGLGAEETLKTVLSNSAGTLDGWGMPKLADATGYTPYQVLVMGSLIEREGIKKDFGKISEVTYRRLAENIKLAYDSTINYVLDRPVLTTDGNVRGTPGPYNTYLNAGLTPTPIAAVSTEALSAAAKPEPGQWRYFVKCQKDGTSCFAENDAQHRANVNKAHADGVF
jgi:UPF0755 protein